MKEPVVSSRLINRIVKKYQGNNPLSKNYWNYFLRIKTCIHLKFSVIRQ